MSDVMCGGLWRRWMWICGLLWGMQGEAWAEGRVLTLKANGSVRAHASVVEAFAAIESGDTLRLYGRHEVTPDYGGGGLSPLNAPLQLVGKRDVVIQGEVDAQIQGFGPGDFLGLTDCTNVVIENILFSGNRPAPLQKENGVFAMIHLRGHNREITVRRCRFADFGNHGISHLWSPKTSTHVLIDECVFRDGGAAGVPGLGYDGAAVSGIGSYWTLRKCRVTDCVRGFEVENSGTNLIEAVQIQDNTFTRVADLGVMLFATNGEGERFSDIQIAGNTFKDFRSIDGSATAIRLAAGHRMQIRNNLLHYIEKQGIVLIADGSMSDVQVRGNTVSIVGNNGIAVHDTSAGLANVSVVDNQVSFCGEAGIRVIDVADVVVSGNVCFNNGRVAIAAGIELLGARTLRPLVRGNKCYDTATPRTQDYGILVGEAVSAAMLRDNYCTDERAVVTGILDRGLRSDVEGNKTSASIANPSGSLTSAVLVNAPAGASITLQPGGLVSIGWPALAGRSYRIDYKASLAEVSWRTLATWREGTGAQPGFADNLTTNSSRFYRIVELE